MKLKMPDLNWKIKDNLIEVKNRIHRYEMLYDREPDSVCLLAVSKNQSIAKIEQAVQAGQHRFGENYVQEALPKITALAHKNLEWHFIGPIQSNKTRKIAENFHWVHSVSEIKIAERLNAQRPANLPPLHICLAVNISHEPTKTGVDANQLLELARACQELPHLQLRGLMTIPAPEKDFLKQRAEFKQLHELWGKLNTEGLALDTLSMGMSDDMEAAIAEGATIIRIGTAIFGSR
jgi:pyridoxal phosphate enzyme (YggS family)